MKLSAIYMKKPTEDRWKEIAERFNSLWNFPNCLGAIDGKHIEIESPENSGSAYFNYKNFNSIVLQAVVDADAKFLFVDIGDYGRNNDSSVFYASGFGKLFTQKKLNLPSPQKLTAGSASEVPFVFVGDDAYALTAKLMKPFARKNLTAEKRIYNYRLSRARRIVECAFGMLTKRFRIFESAMLLGPEKAALITMTCCVLHNMIRERTGTLEEIHIELLSLEESSANANKSTRQKNTNQGLAIRNIFMNYFNSNEGSVSWQNKYANVS